MSARSIITCAILMVLLGGCHSLSVLGDFQHTSHHCLDSQGIERCHYLVTPERQPEGQEPPARTLPARHRKDEAIVFLHPALAPAEAFEWLSEFAATAVTVGYTVVYPYGTGFTWNDGRGGRTTLSEWIQSDDRAYLHQVLADLQAQGIRRYWLAGMSSGGILSLGLYCQPDGLPAQPELAGVVTVVSNLPASAATPCEPIKRVPILMLSGSRDHILRKEGGAVLWMSPLFGRILSVEDSLDRLRQALNCEPPPSGPGELKQTREGDGAHYRFYRQCESGGSLDHIYLKDGGHIWPGESGWTSWLTGRGPASDELDANLYILYWMLGRASPESVARLTRTPQVSPTADSIRCGSYRLEPDTSSELRYWQSLGDAVARSLVAPPRSPDNPVSVADQAEHECVLTEIRKRVNAQAESLIRFRTEYEKTLLSMDRVQRQRDNHCPRDHGRLSIMTNREGLRCEGHYQTSMNRHRDTLKTLEPLRPLWEQLLDPS